MATGKIQKPFYPCANNVYFGDWTKAIATDFVDYWRTSIPNDERPHPATVNSSTVSWFGFASRYSDGYGAAIVFNYNNGVNFYRMNNGSVSGRVLASI